MDGHLDVKLIIELYFVVRINTCNKFIVTNFYIFFVAKC